MTKLQEIEILDRAINELGPDSYLGPWLKEVRGEVQSLISSDHFPRLSVREAAREAETTTQAAYKFAQETGRIAEANAEAIRDRAHKDAERTRENACNLLRNLLNEAQGL